MPRSASDRHLVVCVTNFYPHPGGLERYAEELFSRVSENGWRVTVVTYADTPEREVYRGLRIIRIKRSFQVGGVVALPRMSEWRSVISELESEGVHVISTQTRFFFSAWLGMRWAKKRGIPHVHTEHGSDFVQHSSPIIRWGSWIVDQTIGKAVLKHADVVTCVSKDVSRFVQKLSGRASVVVHNGVDLTFWNKRQVQSLRKGLEEWIGTRKPILFMGRIMGAKGWRNLIQSVEHVSKKEKLAVLFAGTGPEERDLQKAIEHRPELYHYIGSIPRTEVRDILARAAYVNPSFSAEGLQTTLLEAAAMDSWIITTDVSGTGEAVTSKVGVVVPRHDSKSFAEAIEKYLDHKPVSRGREHMEKEFSWEKSVSKYLSIINKY